LVVSISQSNGDRSDRHLAKKFLMSGMVLNAKSDVDRAITAVYRAEWGRIVAILIRLVGDFNIAEEASADAGWIRDG
jgi:hypothetical protein